MSAEDVPRRFGAYELIEEIARGGMGIVWRARQEGLGRDIALKMILAGNLASSEQVLRFYTEAKAAARLDHPSIVPIYDIGDEKGRHFYSMKLIEGRSLAEAVHSGGAFQPEKAARTVAAVARAIHFAHQRGVLHRDLKPSNILLDESDRPFVADFGLARIAEQSTAATSGHAILGTPAYMAPEQAAGSASEVTTSADIYSLGAILHEILTGQPPFCADTPMRTLRLVLESAPARPRSINPRVDQDLEVICLKCLQKEPEKRYATAADLADDLERWLAGEPINARSVSALERAVSWAKRRPELATALCTLSLVLAVAFAVSLSLYFKMRVERDARAVTLRAEEAQRMSFQSLDVLKDNPGQALLLALDAAERVSSLSSNNALLGALEVCNEKRRLLGHFGSVASASYSPDGERVVTAAYDRTARIWNARTGEAMVVLDGHAGPVIAASFSPDGSEVLTASMDASARIWDARSGTMLRRLAGHSHPLRRASYSPDGKLVLTLAQFTARVWSASTGDALYLLASQTDQVSCAIFSPDGQHAATVTAGKTIRTWDMANGQERVPAIDAGSPVHAICYSRDGSRIAAALTDCARVWDAATGKQISILDGHKYDIYSIALSSDGALAATGSEDFTARIWDVRTGQCLHVLQHGHKVIKVALSPDEKLLVSASYDTLARIWDMSTGELVSELKGHASPVIDVAFSPGSDEIATASVDYSARLWRLRPLQPVIVAADLPAQIKGAALSPDRMTEVEIYVEGTIARVLAVASRAEVCRLVGHEDRLQAVCFSPDGAKVVTGSSDKTARVWDSKSGKCLQSLVGHEGPVQSVTYSMDGERVLTAANDGSARVWSSKDGSCIATFGGGYPIVRVARFSPDGNQVAIIHDEGSARIGNVVSGEARFLPRERYGPLTAIDFGPGGRTLLTAGRSTRATLYSLPGEEVEGTLIHPARVTMAVYTPDRRFIVTKADDGVVRLWDATSREEWLDIRKVDGKPAAIQPGWDSQSVQISWMPFAGRDEMPLTVLSYPVFPLDQARGAKFGDLTPDERDHFRAGSIEERRIGRQSWRGGHIYGGDR